MGEEVKLDRTKLLVYVDDKPHSQVALKFACAKARKTAVRVEILYVIEPADYSSFLSVAEVMKEEQRAEAEKTVQAIVNEAFSWGNIMPSIIIRTGIIHEEIFAAVDDDHDINMLVVGAPETSNRLKMLGNITAQIGDRLHIPVLIVPGNLTDQQIEALT